MLIVSDDRAVVEADLAAGRLVCPRCLAGVLGGWGCSRLREVRTSSGVRRLRPRRGRCRERSCRATHVLLPDLCFARRRYVAEVIGAALLSIGREGYRRCGERLGVPGETVRDWRRRFDLLAELIGAHFLRWARALDASFEPPGGRGSQGADADRGDRRVHEGGVVAVRASLAVVVGVGVDRGRAARGQHVHALACA